MGVRMRANVRGDEWVGGWEGGQPCMRRSWTQDSTELVPLLARPRHCTRMMIHALFAHQFTPSCPVCFACQSRLCLQDLEGQLLSMRSAVAEESSRAQRAGESQPAHTPLPMSIQLRFHYE
jgi:hypothetical protein